MINSISSTWLQEKFLNSQTGVWACPSAQRSKTWWFCPSLLTPPGLLLDSSSLSSFSQITKCYHLKIAPLVTCNRIMQDNERLGTFPGWSQSGTDTRKGRENHHCLTAETELQKNCQKSASVAVGKPAQLGDFTEMKASAALRAGQRGEPRSNCTLPGSTWQDRAPDQPALTVSTSTVIPTVSQRNIFVTQKPNWTTAKNNVDLLDLIHTSHHFTHCSCTNFKGIYTLVYEKGEVGQLSLEKQLDSSEPIY